MTGSLWAREPRVPKPKYQRRRPPVPPHGKWAEEYVLDAQDVVHRRDPWIPDGGSDGGWAVCVHRLTDIWWMAAWQPANYPMCENCDAATLRPRRLELVDEPEPTLLADVPAPGQWTEEYVLGVDDVVHRRDPWFPWGKMQFCRTVCGEHVKGIWWMRSWKPDNYPICPTCAAAEMRPRLPIQRAPASTHITAEQRRQQAVEADASRARAEQRRINELRRARIGVDTPEPYI